MTIVKSVLNSLTEEQLRTALSELLVLDQTGILPQGEVRELSRRLHSESGIPSHDARNFVCNDLLRQAAHRWAAQSAKPCIQVWPFYEAPEELRAVSPHGGDEDWLALVPDSLGENYIPWLESGSSFGVCRVSQNPHPTLAGYSIYIGAHA